MNDLEVAAVVETAETVVSTRKVLGLGAGVAAGVTLVVGLLYFIPKLRKRRAAKKAAVNDIVIETSEDSAE